MENKTHYRKVFKSDHLAVADLEDFIEEKKRLVFTIKEVKQYVLISGDKNSGVIVAGRRISANVAFFKENIKPLVVNSKNSIPIKTFTKSSFVQDWKNVIVELYINMGVKNPSTGEYGGVGIKPNQPSIAKPELTPKNIKVWDAAIAHMVKGGDISKIKANYTLSTDNEQKLKDAHV